VIGTLSLVAIVTGWWVILAVLGLQLIVGLRFGRKYCLPCVFYFEVIQPRIGEGELEDSRPPRFANIVGAVFLSAATVFYALSIPIVGAVLGGMVAALALLAATTGFCMGCEIYKLVARARGIKPGTARRIDLSELGAPEGTEVVVQFTHPLCTECRTVEQRLSNEGFDIVTIDVSKNRELAHKYNVSVVPIALRVHGDGRVLERLA
jgi:hypothetical protein